MKIQKIQSGAKNTKGFTLVELIVVITILAILGTIAFISLNGQSANARDSKRKTDLSSIMSKSMIVQTQGVDMISLINTTDTTRKVTTMPIAGLANATAGKYAAGTPNYTAIGISATDFKDTQVSKEYSMAATTHAGWALQLGATLENDTSGNPTKTALVIGNFTKRTNATATIIAHAATDSTLVLTNNFGFFKVGDTISACGAAIGTTISTISADLKTLTLSAACNAASVTTIGLAATEGDSLIGTGSTTYVTDNQTSVLPY